MFDLCTESIWWLLKMHAFLLLSNIFGWSLTQKCNTMPRVGGVWSASELCCIPHRYSCAKLLPLNCRHLVFYWKISNNKVSVKFAPKPLCVCISVTTVLLILISLHYNWKHKHACKYRCTALHIVRVLQRASIHRRCCDFANHTSCKALFSTS